MAVRGTITFNLTDYKGFIKLNRLINFQLEDFNKQIKDAVTKYVKVVITNIPSEKGIPVIQMERQLLQINEYVESYLKPRLQNDFGVNLKGLDIANIEIDKQSDGFIELKKITADQVTKTTIAQNDVSIKNIQDMQAINANNLDETLRIQREETQRSQKLQTESNFMGTHILNQQTEVLKTAAEGLGNMSNMGNGVGMNPAGMMTGMAMGGAMGGQMANMMNQMGSNINQQNTPPPVPQVAYSISINGQTSGPFNLQQLQQLVSNGQLTLSTYVWKQGMTNWELAANVSELKNLFGSVPPPPPIM
jgi:membrane protease subunit (stomatin/prohibitin family)